MYILNYKKSSVLINEDKILINLNELIKKQLELSFYSLRF